MSEAAPEAASKAGNAFTKKLGPFPLWAWGLIVGGIFLGYRVMNRGATSSAEADAATPEEGFTQPNISTLTGSGPAGVGGFFVPIDSFGKAPNIPATPPPQLSEQQLADLVHLRQRWIRYRRKHPQAARRIITSHRTDMMKLATQYFGSPIFWQLIHNANLGTVTTPSDIPPNTPVLIPTTGTAGP